MFYGDVNSFIVKKDVAYLFLTQGQKTIIDREDLERVLDYRWHAEKDKGTFYARNGTAGKLHRFLMDYRFKEIDHIDRDGLNNRKSNLRNAVDKQGLNQRRCSSGLSHLPPDAFSRNVFSQPADLTRTPVRRYPARWLRHGRTLTSLRKPLAIHFHLRNTSDQLWKPLSSVWLNSVLNGSFARRAISNVA